MIGGDTDMMAEINRIFDAKWGTRQVNSDFVLGVKRIMKTDVHTSNSSGASREGPTGVSFWTTAM